MLKKKPKFKTTEDIATVLSDLIRRVEKIEQTIKIDRIKQSLNHKSGISALYNVQESIGSITRNVKRDNTNFK